MKKKFPFGKITDNMLDTAIQKNVKDMTHQECKKKRSA